MRTQESYFDRHLFTTDTNEYATGLNDENEWEEDLLDRDVPIDDENDDFLLNFHDARRLGSDPARMAYNETGFDPLRIN
ncbi:MAG: hypothetical protein LBV18_05440 [Alistipes sp.]|jgi:hypothetical protein|nr:hypothetical protein [Alistipes sp.]